VASRISSKDLLDKRVLGGCGKEVFFFVFAVGGLVGRDVGENVKTIVWGRGDGSAGDDIGRAVRDVEEGVVLWVVKDRPSELGGWGMGDDGLEDTGSNVERAWIVPSVVRTLEDLEDGGGGVRNVLLVYVIKGRPGGDGDVGEGGGGDDGGLRGSKGHFTYTVSSTLETVLMSRPTTVYCSSDATMMYLRWR